MTADTVGGVWTYALDLVRQMPDVQFALATMGLPASPDQRGAALALPNLELFESGYRLEWEADPWHDVRVAGRWLQALAEAFRPDIVHLNGYCHGCLTFDCPKLVVCHSCVLSWWVSVRRESAPPEWDRYAVEVQKGLRGADYVVAPTQAMLSEIERIYGRLDRSEVIPNGRSGIAPQPKEPFVFAAGRMWDEAKNLRALETVRDHLRWPLYIAGDGSDLGRLSPEAMSDRLGKASIYAFPARYEPFGLSVLEAALAGCALVLGDIPSLRENWDGKAVFVHPDDTKGLVAAIDCLTVDESLRNRYGKAAREKALWLSADRFGRRYGRLYEELKHSARLAKGLLHR
jgi:glycogen(starch) synthase